MFHSEQSPSRRLDDLYLRVRNRVNWIITKLTGNSPLSLPNAVAKPIKSLTQYGLCTQDGTPTSNAPVDIMCNNGALKWDSVNQRVYADGTPEVLTVSGANLLNNATNITGKYITASGGISNGDDAQYTDLISVKPGELYVCSLISGRNSGNNRWHGYNENGTWVKQLAYVSATGQQGNKLIMTATIDSGISYVRLSYGITDTDAMISSATSKNWEGYYPIKNYASSRASIDTSTVIQSPYTTPASNRGPAVLCEVEQGKIYIVESTITADKDFGIRAIFYASKDDVAHNSNAIGNTGLGKQGGIFEPVSGAAYAVISCSAGEGVTFTFDSNSIKVFYTDADYQPYVPSQTASVPMLLSVGDVKDEAELISGIKTGKVGIKVFDGTETWTTDTYGGYRRMVFQEVLNTSGDTLPVLCSHYVSRAADARQQPNSIFIASSGKLVIYVDSTQNVSTVEEFNTWLAAQYAVGTPVIVVYPLAEETTEHTTAQNLVTYEGTNIVDSVANVSPIQLEVEYAAKRV